MPTIKNNNHFVCNSELDTSILPKGFRREVGIWDIIGPCKNMKSSQACKGGATGGEGAVAPRRGSFNGNLSSHAQRDTLYSVI